jgi:glycosyltransferase involved in cell wall biosynthesis
MISFFVNIRNTIIGGYPFVESILSALPACEQFIVSDGYSTDGTYEVLKKLADSHPKIELIRVKWEINDKTRVGGRTFSIPAQETREHCKGKHVFYLQANEVIHEDSVERIKKLPEEHPHVSLFHIPYYYFTGKNLVCSEEFRLRLVKNLKEIEVIGDASHMCFSKGKSIMKILQALDSPRGVSNGVKNVITPYGFDQRVFIHAILPKPLFRYGCLFRKNYLEKLKEKINLSPSSARQSFQREIDIISKLKDKDLDKYISGKFIEAVPVNSNILSKPYYLDFAEHPKIMRGLLKSKSQTYFVRKELLK